MFVDDGQRRQYMADIKKGVGKTPFFEALRLSRNFGHQSAILAGMFDNEADIYVTIDADLQDDPDCIVEMLQKIKAGADIVYGVRRERSSDTWFKRVSAQAFYRLLLMLGVKIVYNHADFRMMTRRAVEQLKRFPERNLFLRAVVPLVGFKSDSVYYSRTPRTAGTTKYPLKKMLAFAWNGVSSFSIVPLRLVTLLGFLISRSAPLSSSASCLPGTPAEPLPAGRQPSPSLHASAACNFFPWASSANISPKFSLK